MIISIGYRVKSLRGTPILVHNGSIRNDQMEKMVAKLYQKFDAQRKNEEAKEADEQDLKELKALENKIKSKKS